MRDCPHPRLCFVCQKPGHEARDCPQRQQRNAEQETGRTANQMDFIAMAVEEATVDDGAAGEPNEMPALDTYELDVRDGDAHLVATAMSDPRLQMQILCV